jgi:hypothetical protein
MQNLETEEQDLMRSLKYNFSDLRELFLRRVRLTRSESGETGTATLPFEPESFSL